VTGLVLDEGKSLAQVREMTGLPLTFIQPTIYWAKKRRGIDVSPPKPRGPLLHRQPASSGPKQITERQITAKRETVEQATTPPTQKPASTEVPEQKVSQSTAMRLIASEDVRVYLSLKPEVQAALRLIMALDAA